MKRSLRNSFIVIFILALIFSMGSFMLLNKDESVKAEAITNVFEMEEGAWVRYGTTQNGLRFRVRMSEDVKERIIGEGGTLGFIISTKEYFADLVKNTADGEQVEYINVAKCLDLEKLIVPSEFIYLDSDGYYYANGVVGDMYAENLNKGYSAVAYIRTGRADAYSYEYADFEYSFNNVRSLQQTASRAYLANADFRAKNEYQALGTTELPILIEKAKMNSFGALLDAVKGGETFENVNFNITSEIITDVDIPSEFKGVINRENINLVSSLSVGFENGSFLGIKKGGTNDLNMFVRETDVLGGNCAIKAEGESFYAKTFVIDKSYLDAAFYNQNVSAVCFDLYTDKKIDRYLLEGFTENRVTANRTILDNKTGLPKGKSVISITREDYEKVIEEYLQFRIYHSDGDTQGFICIDNLRPVLNGYSVVRKNASINEYRLGGYTVDIPNVTKITKSGEEFTGFTTDATGTFISNRELSKYAGENIFDIYTADGIVATHIITVETSKSAIDFEDGVMSSSVIDGGGSPLSSATVVATDVLGGNYAFGAENYATEKSQVSFLITKSYLDGIFNSGVGSLAFDIYTSVAVRDFRYYASSGTSGSGVSLDITITSGNSGVQTVVIDGNVYKAFVNSGHTYFMVRTYFTGNQTGFTFLLDNFRPYIFDSTVDFENGQENGYINLQTNSATALPLTVIKSNKLGGEYVYGLTTGQKIYGGAFTISREYLDAVFADTNAASVNFSVYSNNVIKHVSWWTGNGTGSDSLPLSNVNIGKSGAFELSVTRETYNVLVETASSKTSKDLIVRVYQNDATLTNTIFYLDDFNAEVNGYTETTASLKINSSKNGSYEITADTVTKVTVNGKTVTNVQATDTGVSIPYSVLYQNAGTTEIKVYNLAGVVAKHTLTVNTDILDFEDGKGSAYIIKGDKTSTEFTLIESDELSGNYLIGNEYSATYGTDFRISKEYLDFVFSNKSVMRLEFDIVCDRSINYISFQNQAGTELERDSTILSGINTTGISRGAYEKLGASENLRVRIYRPTDDYVNSAYIYMDNFHPVILDELVDFENAGLSTYIKNGGPSVANYLNFKLIETDALGGDYAIGRQDFANRQGTFYIDKDYLKMVFSSNKVSSLTFDIYSDKTVEFVRWDNGTTEINRSTINASGKHTVTITRADYQTLSANTDMLIRVYIPAVADNAYEARALYFDNFRPDVLRDVPDYSENTDEFINYAYNSVSDGTYSYKGQDYDTGTDFFTKEKFQEYKDCGFKVIMPQILAVEDADMVKCLNLAQEVGLKVLLTDNFILFASKQDQHLYEQYGSQEGFENKLKARLDFYADHPAFYGVILADEVSSDLLDNPNYAIVYKAIKKLRPDCYIHANLPSIGTDNFNSYSAFTVNGKYPEVSREFLSNVTGVSTADANFETEVTSWFSLASSGSEAERVRRNGIVKAERYRLLCEKFLTVTGADALIIDAYPMYNSILSHYILNIQVPAMVASARGVEFRIVTQTNSLTGNGANANNRILDKEDLYWINDMLLGFGCANFGYYTYYTPSISGTTEQWYHDGSSFMTFEGEKTDVWYAMQEIMANNQNFAPTFKQFTYKTANLYNANATSVSEMHNRVDINGSFTALADFTVDSETALVTELYDSVSGRYMYMAMNTVDPTNYPSAKQTVTMTFGSEYQFAKVYFHGEAYTIKLDNGTCSFTNNSGEAVFVIPY